eukprot:5258942-Prymnesium_polylepis.1
MGRRAAQEVFRFPSHIRRHVTCLMTRYSIEHRRIGLSSRVERTLVRMSLVSPELRAAELRDVIR